MGLSPQRVVFVWASSAHNYQGLSLTMPTYSYRCTACDHAFDIQQSFTDDALGVCPECKGALRKVFNTIGVTFQGSGFYRTDSRAEASGSKKASKSTSSSSATSASSTPAASTPAPAKPAAKKSESKTTT
jgi:putative FmdB family regulatory protein